ncbi:MAG: uroporphyrinogen-III synthase [Salinisphaera sp.]|jgi:uroporphyrinogen-III synthase|nr:uroporphyrinogen-III synthase [Salinisphaera sp.]
MSPTDALTDRHIAVPESRQLDLFADMLERRGANVMRCPLVDIRDTPDRATVDAWIADVAANGLDDMIWLTGEGVRRLHGFAERQGEAIAEAFWARLRRARSIARGPKPGRELRPLDIRVDLQGTTPTTAGVIQTLVDQDLRGHRIGVQLYGSDPNTPLMEALTAANATTLPVAPYIYADQTEDAVVVSLIDTLCEGRLEAIAFTSSPQIKRLFQVARRREREAELKRALADCCVAAVGPLVAESLAERGVQTHLMPESNYFMKPLVRALSAYFASAVNN